MSTIYRHFLSLIPVFAVSIFVMNCGSGDSAVFVEVGTIAGVNGEFGEPFGIAVRGADIFVSDGENGKILKMSADGLVVDFAVGLDTPSAIAFDENGNLIVADSGSNTIKRVDANGSVTTIAGTEYISGVADGDAGAALFNAPVGLAIGSEGRIYVADTYNDRIRLIHNGKVATFAGGFRGYADGVNARFDTPLGLAVWQDKILVADAGNRRIRVIEPDGRVWTLAGNDDGDLVDGLPMLSSFVRPTAVTVGGDGSIFIADGNAIRVIGRRILPIVETVSNDIRGFSDGKPFAAQFNRPSGLATGEKNQLFVADSDNFAVRVLLTTAGKKKAKLADVSKLNPISTAAFRGLRPARWPFDPPDAQRDISGTLGEIRGEIVDENSQAFFHNGLDIAGAYGETARFIRDEKVLDPMAAANFGDLRELLRMPTLGYIHIRLGRDKDDKPFGDGRFQFSKGVDGRLTDVRVPRGAKFMAGEPIGTLNPFNHVHLIAGRSGAEMNALEALILPNVSDSIAPIIEKVTLFDENWNEIETAKAGSRTKLAEKVRIVVRAFDRMDGNPERRKLGVYKLGYQILNSDGTETETIWSIVFDKIPSNNAVKTVYARGSKSGASGETIFNYIVTNTMNSEGFLDPALLKNSSFTVRVFAADFFGNQISKDIQFEVKR